jgi:hypothetical protein
MLGNPIEPSYLCNLGVECGCGLEGWCPLALGKVCMTQVHVI